MNWIVLIIAGFFEVGWAVGLKHTDGLTRVWPTVWTALSMVVSVVLLGFAMKSLPASSAYAIWVGVGVIGTAIIGMTFLSEPFSLFRLISLLVMLIGIIGLKLSTP